MEQKRTTAPIASVTGGGATSSTTDEARTPEAERRWAEQALWESKERLRALMTNLPGSAVFVVDHDLRYLLADGEALHAVGIEPGDLVGKTIFEALDQALANLYAPYFRRALAGESFEHEHEAHGRFFVSRGTPLWNADGSVRAAFAVSYDITERKRTEETLRATTSQLRALTNLVPGIVWTAPPFGAVDYANEQWYEFTGSAPDVPVGETFFAALHPDDVERATTTWEEAQRTGTPYEIELRLRDRQGAYHWFLTRGVPVCDQAGTIVRWVGISTDITERKQRELNALLLADIGKDFVRALSPEEIVRVVGARVRRYFGVSRLTIADVNESAGEATGIYESHEPNAVSALTTQPLSTYLSEAALHEFKAGRTIVINDVNTDPRTAAYAEAYQPFQVRAQILVPHLIDGRVNSVLLLQHSAPYTWRADQIALVQDLALRLYFRLERARTEEALRATEERLNIGIGVANFALAEVDYTTNTTRFSPEAAALFGLGTEAMTVPRTELYATFHPDERDDLVRLIEQILEPGGKEWFVREFRVVWPDGQVRWLNVRKQVFFDHTATPARPTHAVIAARDITKRKWTEEQLRDTEERFRATFEQAAVGIGHVAPDGRWLLVNQRLCEITGYPADELLGHSFQEITHPEDLETDLNLVGQVLAGELVTYSLEKRYLRKDGSSAWVNLTVSLVRDPAGAPRYFISVIEDISERKRAEEALRDAQAQRLAEERQYAEQLRQLNSASLQINAAPTWDEVLRLTTTTARTLIGAHQAVTSTTADQDWGQAINEVSLSEKYAQWEEYSATPDGSGMYALVCQFSQPLRLTQAELETHPVWKGFGTEARRHPPLRGWLAVPLVGLDGHNLGVIQLSDKYEGEFTAADEALLTQLAQIAAVALDKQMLYEQEQQARAQAEEASRLKDEFLATVSHELRTPLTAFLGYAQLLARKRDEAYIARTVEKMVRSAKAQAQLIEDLLDVSRIVTDRLQIEPQRIDFIPVIRAALDTVRPAVEAKGLHLHVDLRPEVSIIIGDANRLQQVVWNLLSNATKFTPPGGSIQVRLEPDGGSARLTVSDTGQGIGAAFLPYVFDRFRQADATSNRAYGGLGLGLAIVRHLIELHGGTVEAMSAGEGQGATFIVRLPLAFKQEPIKLEAAVTGDATPANCPSELRGLRVLIVDDQLDILELVYDILASCDAVVRTCTDARDALEAVRTWRPDVLISDIAMPDDDGYWLIRKVRALASEDGGNTPAIALTAHVRMEERVRVLAAGFQLYIPKPVEPAELQSVVARLVSTIRTSDADTNH